MSASDERPGIIITETGVSAPDASAIRQYEATTFKGIFGQDLDTAPYTPQGQLIDTDTAMVHDKNSQLMEVLNQFDPEKNDGIWQEGIGKIYFITRKPGARTIVDCEITGIVGTMIPAGEAQAIDKNGNLYALEKDTLITTPSPIPVKFVAMEEGPIICPKESLDRIYKRVNGWDTVINPTAGVTGSWPERRMAFERRRYDSVAKNAHGNVSAIWGALANLDGVISVQIAENVTNVAQMINGVLVNGHSVFISIVGGAPQEIAWTIYQRKDGGCGYDGNTQTLILIPTFNSITTQNKVIVYNRPSQPRAAVRINIATNEDTVSNIEELLREAVKLNWNGGDDRFDRVQIGETILASRFYPTCLDIGVDFYDLTRIRVGRVNENGAVTTWADSIGFTLDEFPIIQDSDIYVIRGTDPEDSAGDGQYWTYDPDTGQLVLKPSVSQPTVDDGNFTTDTNYVEPVGSADTTDEGE